MRLNTATSFIALVVVPAITHGVHLVDRSTAPRTSTSTGLVAGRFMPPFLRRTDLFSPDIDHKSEEMDEMKYSSLATSRLSGARYAPEAEHLKLRHTLVESKGKNSNPDRDGRIKRLKGVVKLKDGSTGALSLHKRASFVSPYAFNKLTTDAPDIGMKAALTKAKSKKESIKLGEQNQPLFLKNKVLETEQTVDFPYWL